MFDPHAVAICTIGSQKTLLSDHVQTGPHTIKQQVKSCRDTETLADVDHDTFTNSLTCKVAVRGRACAREDCRGGELGWGRGSGRGAIGQMDRARAWRRGSGGGGFIEIGGG